MAEKPAWTVRVYLAGDNSLTEEMIWSLQELKKAGASPGFKKLKGEDAISVAAHFDPGGVRARRYCFLPANDSDGGRDGNLVERETSAATKDFVEARIQYATELVKAAGGPGVDKFLELLKTLAPAEGARKAPSRELAAFILSQLQQLDPARGYFIILSGHGSGAVGDFLTDTDPGSSLSIPELGRILELTLLAHSKASTNGLARVNLLGMDSCLMSNAEVCYEIRDFADFLIASEGFVENTGWPYHRVLESLLSGGKPDRDSESVAETVAQSYSAFYRDYELSGVCTDIAICRLSAFRGDSPVIGKLKALAAFLIPRLETYHARRVVEMTRPHVGDGNTQMWALCDKIQRIFEGTELRQDAEGLSAKLRNGSRDADRLVAEALTAKTDNRAIKELKQSLAFLQSSDNPLEQLVTMLSKGEFDKLDPSVALALVRAKRELDPGVRAALDLIEPLEAKGSPEGRAARESLLKFHHLQTVLELHACSAAWGAVPAEDQYVLDVLQLARSEAQSFKGGAYVDLFDLSELVKKRAKDGLFDKVDEVTKLEPQVVLFSAFTGADFQHAHGLSVYFPVHASDYTPAYNSLQFAQQTHWGRLVRAYLEATRRPRRYEECQWHGENGFQRYSPSEIDPLNSEGIEARIVGVTPEGEGKASWTPLDKRAGTAQSIRAGTAQSIRAGTAQSIRGELVTYRHGNPPDGFYHVDEEHKKSCQAHGVQKAS